MKRRMLAGLVLVLVLVTVTPASGQPVEFRGVGVGRQRCETYLEARKAAGRDVEFVAWLGGFLTALSWVAVSQSEKDFLDAGTDMNGWLGWLETYCGEHPLDSFGRASIRLALQLRRRASP